MLKNKIFSKIFGLIMLTSLSAGMLFIFITLQDRARLAEQALVQENKLLTEVTANMVMTGYLSDRWPFQTLKLISDSESIVFLWIVRPNGEIYFADDPAMFGRFIQDFSLLTDKPLVKDAVSEKGEKIKLFIQPLKMDPREEPWILCSAVSLKPIEVAVRKTIIIGVIAVVSIIFLVGLISFYFSKKITHPLRQLGAGALIIGKGDLEHRINIKTGDEIEELAGAFNKMADDLKISRNVLEESKDVLEVKIKARTQELRELADSLEKTVQERTKELQKRVDELERFYRLTVGRELKMVEVKKEVEKLKKELEKVDNN